MTWKKDYRLQATSGAYWISAKNENALFLIFCNLLWAYVAPTSPAAILFNSRCYIHLLKYSITPIHWWHDEYQRIYSSFCVCDILAIILNFPIYYYYYFKMHYYYYLLSTGSVLQMIRWPPIDSGKLTANGDRGRVDAIILRHTTGTKKKLMYRSAVPLISVLEIYTKAIKKEMNLKASVQADGAFWIVCCVEKGKRETVTYYEGKEKKNKSK